MTNDNPRPGFDHNAFYHPYLLRQVPPGCERALDVGCGSGLFASRLADHAGVIDAIDRAPEMIAQARTLSMPNVHLIEADLADHDLGRARYDYIACIASIHHMPFTETLTRLRAALMPEGVLAIVGLYRQATPADYAADLVAIPANVIANAAIRAKARSRQQPTGRRDTAPIMNPELTFSEIKQQARHLLPGAVIRRRLFWRYTLSYQLV